MNKNPLQGRQSDGGVSSSVTCAAASFRPIVAMLPLSKSFPIGGFFALAADIEYCPRRGSSGLHGHGICTPGAGLYRHGTSLDEISWNAWV